MNTLWHFMIDIKELLLDYFRWANGIVGYVNGYLSFKDMMPGIWEGNWMKYS